MTSEADRTVLSRPVKVDEISDDTRGETAATAAERNEIARLLDLVALDRLDFSYSLDREGPGRVHLTGRLQADVTQICVVTLDPVEARLDVPVEVQFWPAAQVEEFERRAEEPGHQGLVDWPEAVVDGKIDLGPIIYETLATALDPYPKRAGASFDWSQGRPDEAGKGESGPFAALAALKGRERR
jgi:uncharacterized metal-binding protein YceD (DUF177 family)